MLPDPDIISFSKNSQIVILNVSFILTYISRSKLNEVKCIFGYQKNPHQIKHVIQKNLHDKQKHMNMFIHISTESTL